VQRFAGWLAQTSPSLAIQTNEWVIPTVQSIHIVAIGVVVGSVLMIALRILGYAGRDQTLAQTTSRFGPWALWGLAVLALTGVLMVVGEPARELLALSFWLKMALVIVATAATWMLRRRSSRALAVLTLLIWASVVVLGRLIAYDYVWGSWSTALKG
jgi:hypothetical protein